EYTPDVTDGSFEQIVLQSKRPVLVDFWAEWCRPCRTLAPIVEAVARRYAGAADVFKLNVDDSPSIAQRYAVQGIPTLILFKDGREQERIVGTASKEAISRMIDSHMSASPDARKVG
ncbi:MAG: thioredoxin, partial [Candidatus Binatia bacterium]